MLIPGPAPRRRVSARRRQGRTAWAWLALLPVTAGADASIADALLKGQLDLFLRYRFEYADDAAPGLREAYASTLRTALGYRTGDYLGASLYLQLQDVRVLGDEDWYNDGSNRVTDRAVIADPDGPDVHQYHLRYAGLPKTVITAGRQEITHRQAPLHRFVGNVLWRQHFQSYDAVRAVTLALPDTIAEYSYVWTVNRIFGEDNSLPDAANFRSDSHLVNLQYNGYAGLKVESYAYLLNFTSATARRFSTATLGLRLQGDRIVLPKLRLSYTGEFAQQIDYGDNPTAISVHYALGELGLGYAFDGWLESAGIRYSYERLEGDGGVRAFQTPLGTNHAFQGFADRFLVTPGDGIQDHFLSLSAKFEDFRFSAVHHWFLSDRDGYDYGREWDLLLERPVGERVLVGFKYADYQADDNALNTARNAAAGQAYDLRRLWAYVEYKY